MSEDGALYLLDLDESKLGKYNYEFRLLKSHKFPGGTGSTPTISADSQRMYLSDDNHNVIALRADDLTLLWSINVGEQVAASIAVAPEGYDVSFIFIYVCYRLKFVFYV
jgi:hypothetical protein